MLFELRQLQHLWFFLLDSLALSCQLQDPSCSRDVQGPCMNLDIGIWACIHHLVIFLNGAGPGAAYARATDSKTRSISVAQCVNPWDQKEYLGFLMSSMKVMRSPQG